ncbi:hypothetical protein IIU_07065 [Bacillus cereus VD133]|uniref:Peptidase S8/S53 domain-containing protein n=1 Tax=Bacillus cereus VD133 TaxID=1053233 RepID=A0A9W5PJ58_BACCE|nr:S8 family serine peptidase [Bacillus cereus]EOO23255.1 hypothetical protein IIU_07065 [Bacillus cereus VD133]
MKNKKYIYIALAISIILTGGFISYKKYNSYLDSGLYGKPLKQINADKILPYDKQITSKIAVIDTGVKLDNTFLEKSIIKQEYTDQMSQSSQQSHGTMVTGILTSNGNGHSGPGGLIPKSNILSIQTGTDLGMSSKQLIQAINIAIDNNVKIINISLGTTKDSPELQTVIKKALEKDITIVASAGNNGNSINYYPAAYEGVISVGSINEKKEISNSLNLSNINIFAPGENLLTTTANKKEQDYFTGNSAATPVITSIVAVMITENPNLTNSDIKSILVSSADTKTYKSNEIKIVNLKNALKKASIKNQKA